MCQDPLISEDSPIKAAMQRRIVYKSSTILISNYIKCQSVSVIGIKDQILALRAQ